MTSALATAFGHAVAAKDSVALNELLHPEVDFRGMTPRHVWEADGPGAIVDVLGEWFGESDVIEGIDQLQSDSFADVQRVGYRLRVRTPDGLYLVEQQAYIAERDRRIGWLRIMCAGYRRIDETG